MQMKLHSAALVAVDTDIRHEYIGLPEMGPYVFQIARYGPAGRSHSAAVMITADLALIGVQLKFLLTRPALLNRRHVLNAPW
ncbi:hypothetical protein [Arthrobacter cavernae]|uniref:Uncharacterized protein n=1 Tax=Arthrobacter cavernae TaxID=2817681 RepID=A0A939HLG8_9MICC|nr:hypothetical protein [Arthrobacter cavernae]MBO1269468.1 hypothetical protein [Arthrobacter cavernae]